MPAPAPAAPRWAARTARLPAGSVDNLTPVPYRPRRRPTGGTSRPAPPSPVRRAGFVLGVRVARAARPWDRERAAWSAARHARRGVDGGTTLDGAATRRVHDRRAG